MTSCTANFILFDMDALTDMNLANVIADGTNENQSLIIHLILDDIDDNIRVVKLETPPPPRSDIPGEFHFEFSFFVGYFRLAFVF